MCAVGLAIAAAAGHILGCLELDLVLILHTVVSLTIAAGSEKPAV